MLLKTSKLTRWVMASFWLFAWVSPRSLAQPATEVPPAKSAPSQATEHNADATIPPVLLSKRHETLCKVKVGDAMPALELPSVQNAEVRKLSDLFGKRATVVVFWNNERRMALEQLADLVPEVVQPFTEKGVNVVGIAVKVPRPAAQATIRQSGAHFEHLLDADGRAFAQVGSEKLPRTYLLDAQGKILWFDIEYSPATRRELQQALQATVGEKNAVVRQTSKLQSTRDTAQK